MSKQTNDELKEKIEAVLFSYGDWISAAELKEILKASSEKQILNHLAELRTKFENGFSFTIEERDDAKWKMTLRPEFDSVVEELVSGIEIPQQILKVLSLIAYEQPVTKTRLSELLGRSVKEDLDYLKRAKFVSYEKRGIGRYYRVTKKFYDYFQIEEGEEFRERANQNIKTFIEEPTLDDEEKDGVTTEQTLH